MASHASAQFSRRQVVLQWSLGMFVATPFIALIQASYQLSTYRINHAHAPRPVMPARGVAVAVDSGVRRVLNTERPLRLLVVGDSLAAGVGMSKSGSPILPESIARSLSKSLGGRAVYWTCVGTPGVAASQIVQDIDGLKASPPGRLERLFTDWQARHRKWQKRRELKRRLTELESIRDEEVEKPKDFLKLWWEQLQTSREPGGVRDTTKKVAQEWWTHVSTRFRATRQRMEEDLTEIKEIVQSTPDDEGKESHEDIVHPGNLFRRDSVDPDAVAQFDVAVVLTGLNDIKEAFLPHMVMAAPTMADDTKRLVGGLGVQLQSVIHALKDKMAWDDEGDDEEEASGPGTLTTPSPPLRPPLVVVPELPVAPLSLFRLVPLCWFLVPLFRAMENNKKFLSASFPDYVVFIPQPDLQWWSDVEEGIGPIRENLQQERLLLRTTDIAQNVRERIQDLMKEHYDPSEDDPVDPEVTKPPDCPVSSAQGTPSTLDNENGGRKKSRFQGSGYVAVDKMHPNDEGYELWGRHIAEAIIRQWNR